MDDRRRRYTAFVARHEIAWELSFGALAVIFVIVGFLSDEATGDTQVTLEAIDWALTGLFAAEFLSRLWAASSRRAYLRGHWIDLFALIPTIRGLRVLRLVRLLRLIRAFAGIYRVLHRLERLARHGGLVWLFTAWLAVMVLCSIAMYAAENGVNQAVNDPFDAIWWGVVTLSTVGYGDVFPITTEGRLAAMVLMVGGISLFAAITATVTSFMVGQYQASGRDDPTTQIRELGRLRAEGLVTDDEFESKKSELLASACSLLPGRLGDRRDHRILILRGVARHQHVPVVLGRDRDTVPQDRRRPADVDVPDEVAGGLVILHLGHPLRRDLVDRRLFPERHHLDLVEAA